MSFAASSYSSPYTADLKSLRGLIVDDDVDACELIKEVTETLPITWVFARTLDHARKLFESEHPSVVIVDRHLPDGDGIELVDEFANKGAADVILMTGYYNSDSALDALSCGAIDFIKKPYAVDRLRQSIRGLVEQRYRRERMAVCTDQLLTVSNDSGIISSGAAMAEVLDTVRRVAPHFRSVLVQGETGTGKELIARALHRLSAEKPGPFVVCNAAAITETLAESEFFGHVKGSFTGAIGDKVGLFEAANGGILFLDEIGEMSFPLQAKLLRAIQSQEIQRVGAHTVRKIDVKIVAATNRDLAQEVAQKRFREDLFYRLSSIEIMVPPLRDRGEDMQLLVRHFVERYSAEFRKDVRGLTRRAENALRMHRWPGNVRELENVISHAVMRADGAYIDLSDLPTRFRSVEQRSGSLSSIDDVVRSYIQEVISRFGGNKQRAAEALNISRSTLYRMLSDEGRQADADVKGTRLQ